MSVVRTVVEILNSSREKIAEIRNFYPINDQKDILQYSKELSSFGKARFRIATQDPLFTQYGNIINPHQYHIRIKRGNYTVWRGVIVDNPTRGHNYVEVVAHEYLWYLSKILIRRDAETVTGDGLNNFKLFNSGTMKTAVQNIITQAAADFGSSHIMADMTYGTVENPNFPETFAPDFTGAWTFSNTMAIQFDYHDALYVLQAFGIYSESDFELDENLVFNFQNLIGKKQLKLQFEYGTNGNIVDYNIPLMGSRMANDVYGIAATDDGSILHTNLTDSTSINTYGRLQEVHGFSDVKSKVLLRKRLTEQLRFEKEPGTGAFNLLLNEKGYPLGQYDIGDIIKVKIKDYDIINFDEWRRIVGITVNLHNTGRELTVIQTNKPRESDLL